MNHSFNYKNINIQYTVTGKGNAIVLLHGFLENSTMWESISAALSKKNKVICIDLLGHGNTGNLGYIHTMEMQAKMVKAVLNHLKLRKYILIGHSMGGYVALAFAKLFPQNVKGISLMNSTALPDTEEKRRNRDRAISVVKQNPKTFIRIAIPMLFSEKNRVIFTSEITQITNEALKTSPQGIIAAIEGMKIRENLTNTYTKAKFPIQLIIGKQDPALAYESLIAQTKDTSVEIIEFPDGHMSHFENTNELILSIKNFVKIC